jgi:hypothetical protein
MKPHGDEFVKRKRPRAAVWVREAIAAEWGERRGMGISCH